MLYAVACIGSTAILAACVVMLMLPRYREWRGAIRLRALFALPGALLLAMLSSGGDYPPIHDITTDTANPPQFSEVAQQRRGEGSNPLQNSPEVIEQQIAAYPQLGTLLSDIPIEQAFDTAQSVAQDLGWEIYHTDRSLGMIEAVDTTAIMAFKDDIVIRVRSNAEGTLLDLRSVSRVGVSDIGANAARIETFLAAYRERENALQ